MDVQKHTHRKNRKKSYWHWSCFLKHCSFHDVIPNFQVCTLLIATLALAEEENEDMKTVKRGLHHLGYVGGSFGHGGGLHFGGHSDSSVGGHSFGGGISGGLDSHHESNVKAITLTKEVQFPLPQPYPVHVEKKVPVPFRVPVPVHVEKPFPIPVPKLYPVIVEHKVPYPVEKKIPYPVKVPVKVPVPVPHPVHIPKPYPVQVPVPQPYPVAVPVVVEKKVPVLVKDNHEDGIEGGLEGGHGRRY